MNDGYSPGANSRRTWILIAIFAGVLGGVVTMVPNLFDYVWTPVVNNTNVGCYGGEGGTCERVNGTTYNATTERDVYFKYHVTNNNAHTVVLFYINGVQVLWNDFTTIQADQNQSFMVHIPYRANYSYYNNSVVHHIEIREYPYEYVKVR